MVFFERNKKVPNTLKTPDMIHRYRLMLTRENRDVDDSIAIKF